MLGLFTLFNTNRLFISAFRGCCATALAFCVLVLLTGCEDPSNVGLGLVGEEEGVQPAVRVVEPSSFENEPLIRPRGSLPRVLAGRVVDPIAGTIEAEGYFDMSSAASSAFREKEVTSAFLQLRPTYTYGDSTEQVTFALRPVNDEISGSRSLPVDTTISTGAIISEFSFLPTDSLVVVPMPESWVADNDALLRSTEFIGQFHGFRLEQVSGNAVIGFAGDSQLRAFADADSALYPISRAYSAIRRIGEPDIPAHRLLYQAGVGPIARFQLDITGIDAAAINQAKLVFQTDTLTLSQKPVGFRRPVAGTLDLFGVLENEGLVLLARTGLDNQGRFVFEGTSLALEFQRVLLGTRSFDHFELRLPVGGGTFAETNISLVQGSIDVQLFFDIGAPEKAPAGYLTVTPLD